MIVAGMPVISGDGRRIGRVERVIGRDTALPPGVIVALPRMLGLPRRLVALTTFDVRDVRAGWLVLRISRWEVRNRASRAVQSGTAARPSRGRATAD